MQSAENSSFFRRGQHVGIRRWLFRVGSRNRMVTATGVFSIFCSLHCTVQRSTVWRWRCQRVPSLVVGCQMRWTCWVYNTLGDARSLFTRWRGDGHNMAGAGASATPLFFSGQRLSRHVPRATVVWSAPSASRLLPFFLLSLSAGLSSSPLTVLTPYGLSPPPKVECAHRVENTR